MDPTYFLNLDIVGKDLKNDVPLEINELQIHLILRLQLI